jgi:hypothetical protein
VEFGDKEGSKVHLVHVDQGAPTIPSFTAFNLSAAGVQTDEIFDSYSAWHKQQSRSSNDVSRCLVFIPRAGLGDSTFSLVQTFRVALEKGLLFFVKWRLRVNVPSRIKMDPLTGWAATGDHPPVRDLRQWLHWRLVLNQPGFEWDWIEAKDNGRLALRLAPHCP